MIGSGMGPSGGLPIDGLGNAAFATNHMAHIPASGGDASSRPGVYTRQCGLTWYELCPAALLVAMDTWPSKAYTPRLTTRGPQASLDLPIQLLLPL